MVTHARPLERVRAIAQDPAATAVRWWAKRNPQPFFARHARLARRAGIGELFLVVSFDCDTVDDARVVPEVYERLDKLGVRPVFAVPGALLERSRETYAGIAASGAEFINHGGAEHTYFDQALGRHASCFFYDRLRPEKVREDVELGHRIVADVIGAIPSGFRTPHFGTYQGERHLRYLHEILGSLGYRFSSSTLPRFGTRHGPVSRAHGLPELPLSGVPESPFEVFDTWAFFAAPNRNRDPAGYLRQAGLLADALAAEGAGVINVYGDPAHVHDQPEFFEAVKIWAEVARSVSFTELLASIR